jgi:tRNA pseudouridine55 synthase
LGQTTSTEDAEGEVLHTVSAVHVTDAGIEEAIVGLRGPIDQVPSAVSAIKVDGERAYKLAREGKTVELAARAVRIERFDVVATRRVGDFVDLDVEVDCSSGTYIRALARDVGLALGVGGHLTALRRTRVGRYGLAEAHTLDQLADSPQLSYSLDEACLLGFPRRELTVEEVESASNGRALTPCGIDGVYAATASDGRVIALLSDDGPRTKSVVVIRPSTL